MNKARLHAHVAQFLAGIGYAAGDYSWPKRGRLQILVNADAPIVKGGQMTDSPYSNATVLYKLPAGMSLKAVNAALMQIPIKGISKPVASAPSYVAPTQQTMVH